MGLAPIPNSVYSIPTTVEVRIGASAHTSTAGPATASGLQDMGRRAFAMEAEVKDNARSRIDLVSGPALIDRVSASNQAISDLGEAGQVIDLLA